MTTALTRVMAEISRASEFFSVQELQAQTGQPMNRFAAVILKELTDNALDAAETGGVSPEIFLEIHEADGGIKISVGDNGDGISPEMIERIKDFGVKVSDKVVYRSPSRGQQGNALKTVLGMPYALGSRDPVVIESCGLRHTLHAYPDPLGAIKVEHEVEAIPEIKGTRVQVSVPAASQAFDPIWWARSYALSNPHAMVKIAYFEEPEDGNELANSEGRKVLKIYHRTAEAQWRKFMPTDLTSPHWYDADTMKRQIFAHLQNGEGDISLSTFVRRFRGLSSGSKARQVCDMLTGLQRLGNLKSQEDRVAELLRAMKSVATPPSSAVLGGIGRDHIHRSFSKWYGVKEGRFWYKKLEEVEEAIPYVIEAAAAEVDAENGAVFHALNFSPTFDDPLTGTWLNAGKVIGRSFKEFMWNCHAYPIAQQWDDAVRTNVALFVHIVSPGLAFLDRGKSRLSLPNSIANLAAEALWSVGRTFYAEGERRKRDAARQARREEQESRRERASGATLRDAVFHVLPEAIKKATSDNRYQVGAKDLHYVVRAMIQEYTERHLDHGYFSQELLTEYQRCYGKIGQLYRDPRGYLHVPHTGEQIPLGTREVESYKFPPWHYDKVLYVEKKGVVEAFLAEKMGERYDMAIIGAEGYATEAARTLLQNADRETDYKIFVLHDADPDGYNIARTLREETARMPGYHVDVIDLGLNLKEALEMELQTEEFTRRKELPADLELTPLELEYFTGRRVGDKTWRARRVELNAMTPAQRIAYLERKLAEHGATAKVRPPDRVMEEVGAEAYTNEFREMARERIEHLLKLDDMLDRAVKLAPFPDFKATLESIKEILGTNPPYSWKTLIEKEATGRAEEAIQDVAWQELLRSWLEEIST